MAKKTTEKDVIVKKNRSKSNDFTPKALAKEITVKKATPKKAAKSCCRKKRNQC